MQKKTGNPKISLADSVEDIFTFLKGKMKEGIQKPVLHKIGNPNSKDSTKMYGEDIKGTIDPKNTWLKFVIDVWCGVARGSEGWPVWGKRL